ncbi:50S ribosomal protein L29 [Prevotella sp. P3-120]|jgi:large subunit ribosomal protein L29|uniref:50S ribosomal protein L29 n=1 Tax=unclassified Prevotella TaxID=2638335 RepID=UPI000B95DC51|nr:MULTISPECIES: 50S ribosomal protein L29 [unclassified Prevotella]MBS7281687.1 50S ribosomal protein L29 [Prevotella sp.]MCF2559743.1 50S ribosomal protein L29 [Xylanibacter brevis]MBS7319959.1 50S ribosomal protein L29 [Prevotella sp.]MCI7001408.1 50S ribosomal protein L29 [Prevotella sp.]MDD7172663.1 50S ribosomal protein L29 [Prevotella sp.]
MKTKEIKELETKELAEKLETEVAKYNMMKINHAVTPVENPSQIKAARRDIARMKTELRQRELNK